MRGRGYLWIAAVVLAIAATRSGAMSFVPQHLYATRYGALDIAEYDAGGRLLGATTLAPEIGRSLRGLAFGPDGLLYIAVTRETGFAVVALDHCGIVQATYRGDAYLDGNLTFGKLAIGGDDIYVAGQDVLTRFDRKRPGPGTVIYTNNQVFDAEVLPSGNVLVASAYEIEEITRDGDVVRTLGEPLPQFYTDIRGIEYDPVAHDIYVSALGHTDFFFQVMRVDADTGVLEASRTFWYADDLFWTPNGALVVMHSREQMGGQFFSRDLEQIGALTGAPRGFVTQYPVSAQCGDGSVQIFEMCDDGNRRPGDGCDSRCVREPLRIGVTPALLTVSESELGGSSGTIRFSARDSAIRKGPAGSLNEIQSQVTVAYGNGASTGTFALAACDPGWKTNDERVARFASGAQSTAPTTLTIESGKRISLVSKGLGDPPLSIVGVADPQRSVLVAHCTVNAGQETCLCSSFPSCRYKRVHGRAMLSCRKGVPDPSCAAIGR
ncbi:MAG: hypothetical protein SF182_11805 [Deltaproteobacteria bacterium]|nr:hypothetical protein [Deltaproteobacteria bacterium]